MRRFLALAAALALVATACGGPAIDSVDETDGENPSDTGDPADDATGASEQEQHVLAVLGAGSLDVEVEGRDRTLASADGQALRYRPEE